MIFKENSLSLDFTNYKARQGCFLIAEPFLNDGFFKRSVILLAIHNNQEGSLGFIINKPITNIYLSDLVRSFENANDWPVFSGGPVQNSTLFYIHSIGDIVPNSKKITDDIYFGGDFEIIEQLIKSNEATPRDIKFFLGYSGWAENQLDEEIMNNSWLTCPADKKLIFGNQTENKCWQAAVSKTPHFYVSNFPLNARWN